jgi:hypothetical protein
MDENFSLSEVGDNDGKYTEEIWGIIQA